MKKVNLFFILLPIIIYANYFNDYYAGYFFSKRDKYDKFDFGIAITVVQKYQNTIYIPSMITYKIIPSYYENDKWIRNGVLWSKTMELDESPKTQEKITAYFNYLDNLLKHNFDINEALHALSGTNLLGGSLVLYDCQFTKELLLRGANPNLAFGYRSKLSIKDQSTAFRAFSLAKGLTKRVEEFDCILAAFAATP